MPSPFTPVVFYRDPKAALAWLEKAFGFETSMLVTDDGGNVGHAEMTFGEGRIGVGGEWGSAERLGPAAMKSPASLAGQGTQFIRVALESGIDDHCARAEAAGARITQRPEDQFYGARVYRALDLEGHVWNFDQTIADVSIAEMRRASGLTVKTSF
jgi:uncharacterized glyoxalase superfamily protein PhnB